jgi:hypothetical protein
MTVVSATSATTQGGAMHEKVNLRQKLDLFDAHWQPKIVGRFNDNDLSSSASLGKRASGACDALALGTCKSAARRRFSFRIRLRRRGSTVRVRQRALTAMV